jgi:serine/threonine-protein kinase
VKNKNYLNLFLITIFTIVSFLPLACCKSINIPTSASLILTPTVTYSCSNGGVVTTLAGQVGVSSSINGTGTGASFSNPQGIAIDSSGNIYVTDANMIRKITLGGVVTTVAGQAAVTGNTNATGTAALFSRPTGVAVDSFGNIYVADEDNELIREITPGGVVTTLAGGGAGFNAITGLLNYGSANGTGTAASFWTPIGIAIDSFGNLFVADSGNNMIRKITSGGVVSTFAGSGSAGSTNATGIAASFSGPTGVAVDSLGNIYVADNNNSMIRKIASSGVVTTVAGQAWVAGSTNGTGTAALFDAPFGITVDSCGNVYVGDTLNNMIRKITSGGVVTTLAGSPSRGSTNGVGTVASFFEPGGVVVDGSDNIYVADGANFLIREIQ